MSDPGMRNEGNHTVFRVRAGDRYLGEGEPAFVIAEAGVNHNGDVGIARKLIETAAEAGADAVKFQSFHAEKVVSAQARKADYQLAATDGTESQLEMLRRLELDHRAHEELFKYCKDKDILFLSTPGDTESADMLDEFGVELFKIGSGEVTNVSFLRHIARKRKPVILSTGMSTLDEVGHALRVIRGEGNKDVALLHCVSEYPAPPEQVNLRAMATLRAAFETPVGYSDHTLGNEIALAAVALGACVIEKHFTLSRGMSGPDHRASLEPKELKQLVSQIRNVEAAMGDGIKQPAPCELSNISVVRRSIFAAQDIPAGVTISGVMLECKRPGTGIPARHYDEVVGRKASRNFAAGEMLDWAGIHETQE